MSRRRDKSAKVPSDRSLGRLTRVPTEEGKQIAMEALTRLVRDISSKMAEGFDKTERQAKSTEMNIKLQDQISRVSQELKDVKSKIRDLGDTVQSHGQKYLPWMNKSVTPIKS